MSTKPSIEARAYHDLGGHGGLRMVTLPNDILREITGVLYPQYHADKYTLQQLRLVNKAFNTFATHRLFPKFETFRLGDSFEHMVARIDSLERSKSSLRYSIKSLNIPRNIIVPRVFRGIKIDSSNKKDGFYEVLEGVIGSCRVQLQRLLHVFPRGFIFKKIDIGEVSDSYIYKNKLDRAMDVFMDLIADFFCSPAFGNVQSLKVGVYTRDLQRLVMGQPCEEYGLAGVNQNFSEFLSKSMIEGMSFDLHPPGSWRFPDLVAHSETWLRKRQMEEFLALGRILELATETRGLILYIYPDQCFLSFSNQILHGLETLCLYYCRIDDPEVFNGALNHLPNLRVLILSTVKSTTTHRWGTILESILKSQSNLLFAVFDVLRYTDYNKHDHSKGTFKFNAIRNPPKTETVKTLLATPHKSDINALKNLLDILVTRREETEEIYEPPRWARIKDHRPYYQPPWAVEYLIHERGNLVRTQVEWDSLGFS